jgi:hypothetical protein
LIGPAPSPNAPLFYYPDTAGIVASRDTTGPGERYTLVNGQLIDVPAETKYVQGGPGVGDLLLAGQRPTFWVNGARAANPVPLPEPADCYVYSGETRADATRVYKSMHDPVLGDVVIVFRKAAGWKDVGFFERSDVLLGGMTCVNEHGEAIEQRR